MTELVIARYREPLDWLRGLDYPVWIYNHGKPCLVEDWKAGHPERWNVVDLPNIGREAHCYLTHITQRYGELAALTVFLHGDANVDRPPAHHPTTETRDALTSGLPEHAFRSFTGLTTNYHWHPDRVGYWRKEILGDSDCGQFPFWPSAMFAVPRGVIHRRARGFWRYCLQLIETENEAKGELAFIFERLWPLLFKVET